MNFISTIVDAKQGLRTRRRAEESCEFAISCALFCRNSSSSQSVSVGLDVLSLHGADLVSGLAPGVCFGQRGRMETDVAKKLFTADEYFRMGETGILHEDDRVELINGEIIEMSPLGNRHVACVDRATEIFVSLFRGKAVVSVQNPVQVSHYSVPQPDILLLKPRGDYYAGKRHASDDVLLVIEVSDTTLRYDRTIKLPLFAASGVPEVWIEDLNEDFLLVFRDPEGNAYRTILTLKRG